MLEPVRHVINAAGYSWAGLKHLLCTEMAARIEAACGALVLLWFLILSRPFHEFVTFLILFCLLMSVEALNTAIERIIDHLSPEVSQFAKVAKDLGSAAVFFLLVGNGLYVLRVTAEAAGLLPR